MHLIFPFVLATLCALVSPAHVRLGRERIMRLSRGHNQLSSTGSSCSPFGVNGACVSGEDMAEGLQNMFCSGDDTVCNVYTNFIHPFVMCAATVPGGPAMCFGDFDSATIKSDDELSKTSCSVLPVADGQAYGVMGMTMPLTVETQTALGFSPAQPATIYPTVCSAAILPNSGCPDGITFATQWNRASLITLVELMPKNPISVIVKEAIKVGLESLALGVSTTGDLAFAFDLYSHQGWTGSITVPAHFYVSATIGLEIPNLPKSVILLTGSYTEFYHFSGNAKAMVNELISPGDGIDPTTFVVGINKGIILSGGLKLKMKTLSGGILNDINLELGNARMYISVSKAQLVGASSKSLPAGLYAAMSSDVLKNLASIATSYCDQFAGVIKAVGGPSCPRMRVSKGSKMGLYVQVNKLGMSVNLPGFDFQCNVDTSGTKCGFADKYFAIIGKVGGFVVKAISNFGDNAGEEIMKVSSQATQVAKGFTRLATQSSINSGNCAGKLAKKAVKAVKKFFTGKSGGHEEVEYGFKKNYNCKGSTTTLFDSDNSAWDNWFNEFRSNSRAECYNQCYLHAVELGDTGKSNLCCAYIKGSKSRQRQCNYGTEGRKSSSEQKKAVTLTFVSDFEKVLNAKDAGSNCNANDDCQSLFCRSNVCIDRCEDDDQCVADQPLSYCDNNNQCVSGSFCNNNVCANKLDFGHGCNQDSACHSGFCHGNKCTKRCRDNDQCSPNQSHYYCDHDNQCTGGGFCAWNKCYTQKFGLGHVAQNDNNCETGKAHDGRCKRKCDKNSKCDKNTPWHWCGSDKQCKGKKAKCKSNHTCNK